MKNIAIKDSEDKQTRFVQLILKWGEKNKRVFPWRKDRTPYKVLLAEILLQRTPATRVAKFFPKFVKKFPSPQSILKTDINDLREFLHPMGLKKRAVWLVRLMKEICERHNYEIPENEEELMKLSGIGLYTARAILIFAFMKDLAIVDTNVARVLQRIFEELVEEVKRPSENKKIWSFAAELIPRNFGPQYNEALLDFAAKICRKNPSCHVCPVTNICDYYTLLPAGRS